MSKINLMKPELANLIAAGEVIERPASVVKELVENSIDANSRNIYIGVLDGGRKKILVRDDGSGMDEEDAKLCFLRHASSKIKSEFDLNRIHTLGFRGEAIPSIASVSKVILNTSDGSVGTKVESDPDKGLTISPGVLRKGSAFEVTDLFFNTPARLKYLKSTQVENSAIIEQAQRLSLGFPNIAFSLFIDDREIFKTSGRGDLLETIQKIYGNKIALSLYQIKGEGIGFSFTGYVGKPEISYSKRYNMLLFLNNRSISDYRISKAIEDAYKDYLPPLRYPFAVIKIDVDSQLVDVNVHPTKKEVRISIENEIAFAIRQSITDVLLSQKPVYFASQDSRTTKELGISKMEIKTPSTPMRDIPYQEVKKAIDTSFHQETLIKEPSYETSISHIATQTEQPVNTSVQEKEISTVEKTEETIVANKLPEMHPIGQVLKTYIICDGIDCFYLIDQHAAAERINYEKTQKKFQNNKDRKMPLFPIVIDLSFKEMENYDEKHIKQLEENGIFTERYVDRSIKVTEIPSFLNDDDLESVINDTVHSCLNDEVTNPVDLLHLTIANIACKMSIRANHLMSSLEMEGLIKELNKCDNPSNCPHGRPTIIRISKDDIEKIFRRTGF